VAGKVRQGRLTTMLNGLGLQGIYEGKERGGVRCRHSTSSWPVNRLTQKIVTLEAGADDLPVVDRVRRPADAHRRHVRGGLGRSDGDVGFFGSAAEDFHAMPLSALAPSCEVPIL